MSGGPMVSLGEALATSTVFTDGDWVESKDQDPEGDVRLVQMADVGDGQYLDKSARFLTSDTAMRLRCTFLEPGDLLLSRMPDPLGRCCVFPGDDKACVTVVDVCIIRTDPNAIDVRWLMHCLNSPPSRRQIARFATGTTRARISRSNLAKIQIPLPPVEEQRRIAAILDHADALRAKRREALARLDELTQSIFIDMFGDPISNPRSWPKRRVADIGTVTTGNTPPRARDDFYGDHIEWIKSDNINVPNAVLTPATEGLSVAGVRVGRVAPAGSILMTCIAGSPSVIGNVGIADRDVAFNQQINAIQVTNGPTRFWYEQLRLAKRRVQDASTGGMKGLVSKSKLESVELICPPDEVQEVFADRAMEIARVSEQQQSALGAIDALFASLQSRAFRGER